MSDQLQGRDFYPELEFRASRSSGAGGQHVNKVATQVELLFDVSASQLLTDEEKHRIKHKLINRIDTGGLLHLSCNETRSQHQNKEKVVKRFYHMLERALKREKPRKKTKMPKSARKALRKKQEIHKEKKQNRKKIQPYKYKP